MLQTGNSEDRPTYELSAVIATYHGLLQRFTSNADLQWRTPTLVLTAEAFVFAGVFALGHNPLGLVLGFFGLYVGVAGALTMRRIRLLALVDRQLLDQAEYFMRDEGLLPAGWPVGVHRLKLSNRIQALANVQRDLAVSREGLAKEDWSLTRETDTRGVGAEVSRRFDEFVVAHSPPSQTWLLILLTLGSTAFGVSVYQVLTG